METNKPNEEIFGTYQTGVTQTGKSYRGVIAVLLMLVIFLSGVVTALGLVNVQLFRQLNADSTNQAAQVSFETPVVDGEDRSASARMDDMGTQVKELGIWYEQVSDICNQYYGIPQGPLITAAQGQAKMAGVQEGDILLKVKGNPIQEAQDLQTVLEACQNGETVELTLYRVSEKKELRIMLPVVK